VVLEKLIPVINRADIKFAEQLIAASKPEYRFKRGPASAVREIANGKVGSTKWKLVGYVLPTYPLGDFERRSVCWHFIAAKRSGSVACSRDLAWLRISRDVRVVAVNLDSRFNAAQRNQPIRLQGFWAIGSKLTIVSFPITKTRKVPVQALLSVALITASSANACAAFLGDAREIGGNLYDPQDPSDPCNQVAKISS
jgi:hypothetical protein